jgi:ABC-2 type transport system ATP-binding protein
LREIYCIEPQRFRDTLDFLVETLDVRSEINIQIRRLSLGERMKMELIAALLHEPRVVFLDEPTIGLDLTAQKAIRRFILEYRQRHQPAMILTSHYMEDIEQLCERILIIREGELVYDGPLASVIEKHARHKYLSVQLRSGKAAEVLADFRKKINPVKGEGVGSGLVVDETRIRFRIEREELPTAAAFILQSLPVKDLTIEDPDVGSIIEGLIRREDH